MRVSVQGLAQCHNHFCMVYQARGCPKCPLTSPLTIGGTMNATVKNKLSRPAKMAIWAGSSIVGLFAIIMIIGLIGVSTSPGGWDGVRADQETKASAKASEKSAQAAADQKAREEQAVKDAEKAKVAASSKASESAAAVDAANVKAAELKASASASAAVAKASASADAATKASQAAAAKVAGDAAAAQKAKDAAAAAVKPAPAKAAPKPAPAPAKPAPKPADATSQGLTETYAISACSQYADQVFPYGVKLHWIVGLLAHKIQDDQWFLKVNADVTNGYGAKQKGVNVECFVSGTNNAPDVVDFNAY